MRLLAMIAESLAVIGGDHHKGRHQGRLFPAVEERAEQRRQEGVRGRDLPEIEIVLEAGSERLRRFVGSVGIVEVHPEETRLSLLRPPPCESEAHHLVPAPLGDDEVLLVRALGVTVVVDVEPAIEPELRVERKRADERSGGVARAAQDGGEGRHRRREPEAAVLAHAVLKRIEPGEDVGVGGQRHHVVSVGVGEHPPLGGQAIENGSLRPPVAGETRRVGAQGVDGDQDDVASGAGLWRWSLRRRRRCREQGACERGNCRNRRETPLRHGAGF